MPTRNSSVLVHHYNTFRTPNNDFAEVVDLLVSKGNLDREKTEAEMQQRVEEAGLHCRQGLCIVAQQYASDCLHAHSDSNETHLLEEQMILKNALQDWAHPQKNRLGW